MDTWTYQHNAADIEITKTETGYEINVTKVYRNGNFNSTSLWRRSYEEARKAARYYAERM